MNKTIKSGVRKMLFRMISKFEERQQEKDAQFNQKQDCLRVVLDFLGNLENVVGVDDIVKTVEKLTDLEQQDRIKTQNQYLDEIASITDELIWSLGKRKVASKNIALPSEQFEKLIQESFENITPQEWKKMTDHVIHIENKYKERDRITEENLESFIINVGDSDSSESDESFEMEMLDSDSDFEYGSE